MNLKDLNKEYDKLQKKYGAKDLDSIYNGGCDTNPDICFVFMNPTGRNCFIKGLERTKIPLDWNKKYLGFIH